ncbi:phosphoribosylanthranilate isomerase [Oricola thermophila]|uniref:N-(5'-phosphoribosyl)anthranilate isomerase n=1 Tax=Oricola thermophila TaxID=2742145 RepID=A0A6N1VG66_9HYPH|nr:phosphoribosylanthranilate isomerase [Oricola thermophila]QKV19788.1 phosphoribosylanthranilate isomerase [Oricola thermophila]
MTLDIKICGLKTPEAIDAALDGGATHVGFIFFLKSPRNVDVETAAALARRARAGGAKTVAVTVDADDAFIESIVTLAKPDMLQLHGGESRDRVREIRERHGLPVMKALAIREAADLAKCVPYLGVADRFLFDARPPDGSDLPGGNGVSFDWQLLATLDDGIDYMLSGGLDPENVAEALAVTGARGLDVSSGVESAPGVKDINRIAAFLKAARAADARNGSRT